VKEPTAEDCYRIAQEVIDSVDSSLRKCAMTHTFVFATVTRRTSVLDTPVNNQTMSTSRNLQLM
jgi:hypothetical protein